MRKKIFFLIIFTLCFSNCSTIVNDRLDWRTKWNEMEGSIWWLHSKKIGNSCSKIEFYKDSIIGYDYTFSPFKQKAVIMGKLTYIDSLEVLSVHKFKWYIVGKKDVYHESENYKLLTTLVKIKEQWYSDIYDFGNYYNWAIGNIFTNLDNSDSLYMGYLDDDTNIFYYSGWCSKKPINIDISNISPF